MTAATRMAFLQPKRKRRYSRKPTYTKRPKASLTEGGVNGGHAVMVPNILPPVQEVKFFDNAALTPVVLASAGFTIVNGTTLTSIVPGTGASNRIGRNIRVVGVVVRALTNSEPTIGGGLYSPVTLDLVWDNQCNGSVATVAQIYSQPLSGCTLPNPLFDNRFKFAKRVQITRPNGALNLIDYSYTCNKLVEYQGDANSIASLSKCNLYLIMSSPGDASATIEYSIRVLYVDA